MSKFPVVSVIVPVYNTQAHLRQCIDSILSQSFSDFELILVDDGSQDASGAICDGYTDPRVRTIHQQNGGVSTARNAGIELASGKYLTFVDSDDFLDDSFLMDAVTALETSGEGMFLSGLTMETYAGTVITEKNQYHFCSDGVCSARELLEQAEVSYPIICICGPWCKLVKREVIQKYHIRFDPSISLGEDTDFNMSIYREIGQVYCSSKSYYHYRRGNSESLFTRFHAEDYDVKTQLHHKTMQVMSACHCSAESMQRTREFHFRGLLGCIHARFWFDRPAREKREIIRRVMHSQTVKEVSLHADLSFKSKICLLLLKLKASWMVYLLCMIRDRK